ncbi:MAG: methyltransferase domain-containing protein [Flavobacterium sp.]
MRKPFQGVLNIIRFNWHFYILSSLFLGFILLLANYVNEMIAFYLLLLCLFIFFSIFISLFVSYYVYDLSGLYKLDWIEGFKSDEKSKIVNINAGFDETSVLLKDKFSHSELVVFDFYNPLKHTEISIQRARKAYPPYPKTLQVATTKLSLEDNSVDKIFVIFSAHEIRNEEERILFFKELKRILKPKGEIIITEHLRDFLNFLAYNIGFFHFYSKSNWFKIFASAELHMQREQKLTSFISSFTLTKYGITS